MNSYFTGFIWGWGRCLGAKRTWVHRTWLWNFQKCRIIGVTKGHNPYLPYLCCKILHQFFQDSIKLATKNTDLSCVSTFWQFCSPQGKGHEHEALVMLGLPHVAHTNNWVHKWPWRCYSSLGNLPHFPWKFTRKKKNTSSGKAWEKNLPLSAPSCSHPEQCRITTSPSSLLTTHSGQCVQNCSLTLAVNFQQLEPILLLC